MTLTPLLASSSRIFAFFSRYIKHELQTIGNMSKQKHSVLTWLIDVYNNIIHVWFA